MRMSCPRHAPAAPAGLWGGGGASVIAASRPPCTRSLGRSRPLYRAPFGWGVLRGKLGALMAAPIALSPRSLTLAVVLAVIAAFAASLVEGMVAGVAVLVASTSGLFLLVARRQATAARHETANALIRLQAIIDSMPDGVIFVDADERVALVNEAGKALKNLVGPPGRDVKDCHPQATPAMPGRVMHWLREGSDPGPTHSIIKEKEGRFETTYAPVRDRDGSYLGVVMVIRDIADRRGLERRLLDAERLAAVGQMSAQVAHELRNPLNAITGAAQYLRRVLPDSPEVAEYGALIAEEVQRVNGFVGDLLHVAKPANPTFAPSSVNKVLSEAAQRTALARGLPTSALRLELARGLPVLDLDRAMILEAIVNLL